MKNTIDRRDFLSSAAVVGAFSAGGFLTSCTGGREIPKLTPLLPESEWNVFPYLPDKAKDGVPLKAGLVGCGRRGTGAVQNLLNAADNVSITALGDVFSDRIAEVRSVLKNEFNMEVADDRCFTGFDSYQRVIDTDVDIVLLVTPPAFRPIHFKAAVEAGKHAFLEKPLAVDPAGALSVIATSKKAVAQGLVVFTGTQRHHQRKFIESYKQVQAGLIGEIVSANMRWNTNGPWFRLKEKGWTDVERMIREWVNWTWLSGDHIVEQHIHMIDLINWFLGRKPVKALGFGARHRRPTGYQYDMFSVDYVYEGNIHVHSMCRQIDGCANKLGAFIQGAKGSWENTGEIKDLKGNILWQFDAEKEKAEFQQTNEFVLEHVNMINHIRDNKSISQAEETAISTLTAIMGRMSAYTGQEITWEQLIASDMNLMPENLTLRDMDMSKFTVPVPGKVKDS